MTTEFFYWGISMSIRVAGGVFLTVGFLLASAREGGSEELDPRARTLGGQAPYANPEREPQSGGRRNIDVEKRSEKHFRRRYRREKRSERLFRRRYRHEPAGG